ncbi:prepilin-type N-terminal cleavage/methylation domain-containing protein [Candidatus Peregrinibacteria bacterium]|nr:prepilin-type N-terminal cleavage/methylation domain-containing protein [Candidatus Peregrinibacteria bacterium]
MENDRAGFTLAEVLISFTVLALTFSAAVGLLLSSMQANRANKNDFIAYGLAQEGLEAMRNIRDSNWMQNFPWSGTDGAWKDAGGYFGEVIVSGVSRYYRVSYNVDYKAEEDITYTAATVSGYNPWVLEDLGTDFSAIAADDLALSEDDLGADIFSRYIEIRPVFFSGNEVDTKRVKISSVVFWNEKGRGRKIVVDTILTNWRGI